MRLIRRNKQVVPWGEEKIEIAVRKAFLSMQRDSAPAVAIAHAVTERVIASRQSFVHSYNRNAALKLKCRGAARWTGHPSARKLPSRACGPPTTAIAPTATISNITGTSPCIETTAFRIDYKWILEAAARRQKWIDQAQSLDLWIQTPDLKTLSHMYRMAWRVGLKTTYYLRSLGSSNIEKSTVAVKKEMRGIAGEITGELPIAGPGHANGARMEPRNPGPAHSMRLRPRKHAKAANRT